MSHHRPRAILAGLTLALVWPLAGCELATMNLRAEAREQWSERFSLPAGGSLEIDNTNGAIEVEPAEGSDVDVRAERVAKAATDEAAKELLKQIEIQVDRSDTRVKLVTRYPRGGIGGSTEVRYFVKVPASVAVKVENTNGRISLRGLAGAVEAETTNGGVSGRALSGPVKASTTNGGVDLEVDAVHPDGLDLSTTNGGVSLRLPASARADLEATCVNGGISISGLALETSESTRRRVEGRLNGGGPRVRLRTTNGGVRVSAKDAGE